MITWHAGNEVRTDGKIITMYGGDFYEAIVTNHHENHNVGKKILMAVYQHPEVTKALEADK